MVRGDKEGIEKFVDALTHKGDVLIGHGARIRICNYGERSARITGEVKWSLLESLIGRPKYGTYLTIFEACEKFAVNMEVYAKEPLSGFQEHLLYENGKRLNDIIPYREIYGEYTGELIDTVGGYPSWNFTVNDVR